MAAPTTAEASRVTPDVRSAALAVGLGSVLYGLAFPPLELAPLAWLAYAPMLALAVTARDGATVRIAGLAFGTLAYGVPLRWLYDVFGEVAIALFLIFGFLSAIALQLVAWLAARVGPGRALALAPFLLVGLENFRSEHWALRFGWASPGYAQAADPLVSQAADLAGVYGLSLACYGASAAFAWALVSIDTPRPRRWAVGLAPVLVWLVLAGYGFVRRDAIAAASTPGAPIRVAAVQYETNRLEDAEALATEIPAGTELAVFPELGAVLADGASVRLDAPAPSARLAALSHRLGATLVVGGVRDGVTDGPNDWLNSLLVFDPAAGLVHTYAKAEPVPLFGDGARSGPSGPRTLPALGVVGLAICYDFTHPHVALSALRGAHLGVVSSGDLASWGPLQHLEHARIASLRAIEHRTWVVRATSSGTSQILSPTGAEVVHLGFDARGVIAGEVHALSIDTPYEALGLTVPYLCLTLTALVLLAAIGDTLRRRQVSA